MLTSIVGRYLNIFKVDSCGGMMKYYCHAVKNIVIIIAILTFVFVAVSKKMSLLMTKLEVDLQKTKMSILMTKLETQSTTVQPKLDTVVTDSTCKVNPVSSLENSVLNEIQNERKSRIHEVCEMCLRNRSAMECNHLTMDEDEHKANIYTKLIVDEKHKVKKKTLTACFTKP